MRKSFPNQFASLHAEALIDKINRQPQVARVTEVDQAKFYDSIARD
jgi:hypothetical protein